MKQSLRIPLAAALPAVVLACIACVSNQALASTTPAQTPAPSAATSGVAVVDGRLVVAGTNQLFIPRGFTSASLAYPTQYAATLCSSHFRASLAAANLQEAQAAMTATAMPGFGYNASLQAMVKDWHANTVRFNLSQGALQYEYTHGLSAYTDMVRNVIEQTRSAGLIVILCMQTERYSCTPYEDGGLQKLPDLRTEQAWKQLLDSRLTHDKGVILEVFNEPSTTRACADGTFRHPDWKSWAHGCGREPDQGMLTVGRWLRQQAPENVLLFMGDGVDFGFSGFTVPRGMPPNSAYSVHPYQYVVRGNLTDSIHAWNTRFGNLAVSGHAVIATEWDEGLKHCPNDPNQTITRYFIQRYLPAHAIGITVYGWDAPVQAPGYIVNSYNYPGNTATYQFVDPNADGCGHDAGRILQKTFRAEAVQ
ncbi:cellulase family glycosylhydrolase [Acidithiobacillus thiooxidans]|uniref:cellulase family glycosylhydrolase n=1 Tax=Acidithiobacillus thiooxidans TaxID=930 RepID=UPI003567BC97